MTTTTKTAAVTEADIEKYLAAKEEVSFKYNKVGAKIWYHARAIIGTGAIDNGKFAGWSVDHDAKINRYEAALYLEKYGLTVEQFVAAEKEFYATRYPKDEATAEDNVEATTKSKKAYSINPVIDEDSPVKFNHVDICIENGVLKISGLFECWKPETAYRRFRKIMAQAASEVPELDGWDNWEPAKKLTFDETEKIWLNENDEMIFDTKYTTNTLNIDINEDSIYIWGTFYTTAEAYRAAHPEEPNCNLEAEQSTAQVEETEEKFIYTTNRGNTREVKVGETGSTVRGRWYYYHEIGGMSEHDVIDLATKQESGEFVNALCKFIVNDTDGSEEDDDEIFSANVMPDEDDDTDDELIDPLDRRTVERNSGNYVTWINGEYVRFENHSIVYIDAERKIGYSYSKVNGRKNFYRYGRKIAAAKIAETYMNGERAAEQSKAPHEFFNAHKLEVGNPFKVSFEITTADGREHFFMRTFDTFAEAKALVDEFTSTFSEPTLIVITQNKQGGDWYYSRDVDGTEKFFDAFCNLNATENSVKAEEKNFTANCYYTYTKDGDKRNGLESKKFATATEAAIWILNYVRENGYTLVDGTNIRDCTDRKEYFMSESDFSAAEVEPNTEEIIATIDPEIIYKAVKTVGGEVRRTISRGFEKGGKEMWFSFGRRISKTRAAELLAECGFRSIDEFIAAEKVAEQYKDELLWPRWYTNRQKAKFLRDKIWAEVKPCDDNAEVFNLLPDVNTLNDVEDEINADDAAEDNVEAESAPDNTKTPNEVYRPFTVEAETVNVHGQTFSFINIYGERVTFVNGEVHIISSDKYDAHFNRQTGKYVAAVVVDGNFKPITFNTTEEFFAEMVKRGACTIDEQKPTPEHPTVEELNQPTTTVEESAKESEPVAVNRGAKFVEGKFYNDMDWATFGAGKKCFKILKRTACYVTIGDYSPYWKDYFKDDRYKIKTDSDGNEYINYWSGERLCAKFLTVDENLRDSLERAIEIARQKYREYKREGDKAGMRHESELFEICRKAVKELEVA